MAMPLPKLLNRNNFQEFFNGIDNIMTDCDGVLWSVNNVIPGANDALNKLRNLGKRIFYVTNNSTKTRKSLQSKCEDLGFIANEDEVISTSFIVAQYLSQRNFKKKAYVLGSTGITDELDKAGIPHTGVGPDEVPDNFMDLEHTITLDPDVEAVIVGFDPFFNLPKVMRAASYLKSPECLFVATNRDEEFPTNNKKLLYPGTGVFVAAVETATGRKAESMGKPNPRMFTVISEKYNLDPKRTLMIGDRCNTDILLGKNCGLQTLCVLSGITTLSDLEEWSQSSNLEDKKLLADYYVPSLGIVNELLSL